jgi:hypothetical protein
MESKAFEYRKVIGLSSEVFVQRVYRIELGFDADLDYRV